jgi:hypothetical protein
MSITINGTPLNQRQLDAITPAFNEMLQGKIAEDTLDARCIELMAQAGCPIGYDTGIEQSRSLPIEERARNWRQNGRVGLSSKVICDHMQGRSVAVHHYPSDPDDLNRCLLLLDLIPEWRPRIREMANYSREWSSIALNLDALESEFLEEVGLDWCKSRSAPKTWAMMRRLLAGGDA